MPSYSFSPYRPSHRSQLWPRLPRIMRIPHAGRANVVHRPHSGSFPRQFRILSSYKASGTVATVPRRGSARLPSAIVLSTTADRRRFRLTHDARFPAKARKSVSPLPIIQLASRHSSRNSPPSTPLCPEIFTQLITLTAPSPIQAIGLGNPSQFRYRRTRPGLEQGSQPLLIVFASPGL